MPRGAALSGRGRHQLGGRRARVRCHRRADRLRQVHPAQRCRRPAAAERGRRPAFWDAPLAGLNTAAGYLLQQDAVMPWKTARDNVAIGLEVAGTPRARGPAAGRAVAQERGSCRLRRPLPAPAVRRAKEARRPRASADPRSQDPADGRAVRAARCTDAADHGQPAARAVGRRPQGRAVHHPRPRGGDRAGRPGRDHVGGAGRRASSATTPSTSAARAMPPRFACCRAFTSCTRRSGAS